MARADGAVDRLMVTPSGTRRLGSVVSQALEIESQDLDFGAPELLKELHYVLLEVTEYGSLDELSIQIGWKDRLQDPITWGQNYPAREANAPIFIRPPQARYFRLRVGDANVQALWKLSGVQIYGTVLGARV